MIGITSYGAYIPRLRLNRRAIFQNMGWFAPAIVMVAQGERSMCNWDEDALTMAVAASRDCLIGQDKSVLDGLYLASTTLPFADRQNAGIVATALNMPSDILAADFTASQRAGTNALLVALESVKSGERRNVLVTASDMRKTKPGDFYEMWFGDGAASLMVGSQNVIADFKGSYSTCYDFVSHYRGNDKQFDYRWEERWTRDEGYAKIIPEAVKGLTDKLGITIDEVDRLIYPCFFKTEHKNIARKLNADPEKIVGNLHAECGETGVAHPLVMFVRALEDAKPGDRIIVAGFGQGCNALYFVVTDAITKLTSRIGVAGCLANKVTTNNYARWLKFRDLIDPEMGIRAEASTQTAMTTLWRKRKMLLGLVGGKCRECQTPQFPQMDICVNPNCGAHHSQDDYEFADVAAKIKTFTSDLLAVSVDPPHKYGMIQFKGGGRMMADFTDCEFDDLKVGLPIQMVFRKRVQDKHRGFVNYFWKAAPVPGATKEVNKITYNCRVAVITGAGAGLGRAYALELARRGAQVVVNDLGGAPDGFGSGSVAAADKVVAEIVALGGHAVANYDNVATTEGGESIIQSALDNFGRVDIVINNAGILRDKSFLKIKPQDWQSVLDVHLNGAYNVTRPAFGIMKENGFGRIVMTTSTAGLYGNFGQSNYAAAKLALVGLMNSLKIEGQPYNIKVNTIAPLAASRLTEGIMPPEIFDKAKPDFVVPLVVYLCSDECKESGAIFNAGMGYYDRAAILTGSGTQIGDTSHPPTLEQIEANWDAINTISERKELTNVNAAFIDLITPVRAAIEKQTARPADAGVDVQEIFNKMGSTFRADAAAGVDVVFQFVITGTNGGDWNCQIKNQTCTIDTGTHTQADCTLKMAAPDFNDMMTGKLSPMQAFTSGKLIISGDVMKSQLIETLFSI